MTDDKHKVRLDKWLWAARFFKTRSLAAAAIKGGKIRADGERAKPSREARVGMHLAIHAHDMDFEVVVLALSDRRGPATEAQRLYEESEASKLARQRVAEQRKLHAILHVDRPGRPTKKDRRAIVRFTRRSIPE